MPTAEMLCAATTEDASEDALKAYEKGQTVKVKLLDIDAENEPLDPKSIRWKSV